jgi:hypothetical protein
MNIRHKQYLLGWTMLALLAGAAPQQPAPAGLMVDAQVPPGVYYVGQAIELRVGVEAAGEQPKVVAPRIPDAEVTLFRSDLLQRGASGIGDVVSERIYHVFRFRIVAKREGVLEIPPVIARANDRVGSSAPVRVSVRSLPAAGRPPTFLGGVGRLEVDAEVVPETIRAGQDFEYRIQLLGPGARGSIRPPDLPGVERLAISPELEALPTEAVADPPSRVFRFRLRPTRAGEVVLPPVAIAFFDPKVGRYLTKTTPGVPVRVVDVAAFDPSSLNYGSASPGAPALGSTQGNAPSQSSWMARWTGALSGLLIASILVPVAAFVYRIAARARDRRLADPARYARLVLRKLDPSSSADTSALLIAGELVRYLKRATGRPEGVLTPVEARRAFEDLANDPALGDRADRLVGACDQALYSARVGSAEALVEEARPLFTELGRLMVPPGANHFGENHSAGKHGGRHPEPALGDGSSLPPDLAQTINAYLR